MYHLCVLHRFLLKGGGTNERSVVIVEVHLNDYQLATADTPFSHSSIISWPHEYVKIHRAHYLPEQNIYKTACKTHTAAEKQGGL